ncbi:MAG: hypothetical protein PHQ14_08940 [Chromatiales bacterium]|jgi:hypothetical protein|nr:hypothetical protein [Chromatiales bacterium]MDX9767661.1 hypothetical protein [Ectothiorhodospiraceae bacterium]
MSEERNDKPEAATKDQAATQVGNERRRFLKAAGATALAVPVMETLSGQGLLVRSARAQSAGGGQGGGIGP